MAALQYSNRAAPYALNSAIGLLGDEKEGVAFDFKTMQGYVRDRGTPANFELGDPNDFLTYTAPSAKYVRNASGLLVSGTTLRTHHDGAGEPLGLLVEKATTNLFTNSEAANSWTKIGVTVSSDFGVGPDGATTMDKLVENTATSSHGVIQVYTYTSGVTYTQSRWVRAAGRTKVRLAVPVNNGAGTADFDLSTGSVITTTGAGAIARIEDWGGGLFKISLTVTATDSVSRNFSLLILNGSGDYLYTGDNTSGVETGGAQLEANALVTSYIKTTGSTATRAIDTISLLLSAMPYTAAAGTLLFTGRFMDPVPDTGVSMPVRVYTDSTHLVSFWQYSVSPTRIYTYIRDGGSNLSGALQDDIVIGDRNSAALAWAVDDYAMSLNGETPLEISSGAIPDLTGGSLLFQSQGAVFILENAAYIPRRIPNAELQARTTL